MRLPAQIRPLVASIAVSETGTQVTTIAAPLVALTVLHATPSQVALVTGATMAGYLLVGLPAGALVDRWDARSVALWADVVRVLLVGAVPALAAVGVLRLDAMLVLMLCVGCATTFGAVAHQGLIPRLVDDEHYTAANAAFSVGESCARVAGPPLGGLLVSLVGPAPALVADAVTYLLSGAALSRLRAAPAAATAGRLRDQIRQGLAFVVRHRLIRRLAGTAALINFAFGAQDALFVVFCSEDLGLGPTAIGVVYGVGAGAGVATGLVASRVIGALGERAALIVSAVAMVPAAALTPAAAFLPAIPLLIVGEMVFYFALVVFNVAQVTARMRECPPELVGRMTASVRVVVLGVQPLGALAAAAAVVSVGVGGVLWAVVVVTALAVVPVLGLPRTTVAARAGGGAAG